MTVPLPRPNAVPSSPPYGRTKTGLSSNASSMSHRCVRRMMLPLFAIPCGLVPVSEGAEGRIDGAARPRHEEVSPISHLFRFRARPLGRYTDDVAGTRRCPVSWLPCGTLIHPDSDGGPPDGITHRPGPSAQALSRHGGSLARGARRPRQPEHARDLRPGARPPPRPPR